MDKKNQTIGVFIIASAIIWGLVIIACSSALKGTECYDQIQNILVGAAAAHMLFIWSPLALLFKKGKNNNPEDSLKE